MVDNEWVNKQLAKVYSEGYSVSQRNALDKITERYVFSQYLIDPVKFRFRKVVRIVAIVMLFIKKLKIRTSKTEVISPLKFELPAQFAFINDRYLITDGTSKFPFNCKKGLVVELSEHFIKLALNYFFLKASSEVKMFNDKSSYKNISKEINGVLVYSGRILPSQQIDHKVNLSDVCHDLMSASFCVPLIDRFSPVAYAIVNEIHWFNYDVCHSGNETILTFVLKITFILEGRSLVQQFRRNCPRCRYLNKKAVAVAMGPVSDHNLSLAPAFYVSRVDIFDHFQHIR